MRRAPAPVRPRQKDAIALQKAIRRQHLDRIEARLHAAVSAARSPAEAYQAVERWLGESASEPSETARRRMGRGAMRDVAREHRRRMVVSVRSAWRVDVSRRIPDATARPAVEAALDDMHARVADMARQRAGRLKQRIAEEARRGDGAETMKRIRRHEREGGSIIRRKARTVALDTSRRLVGDLTELRHDELGMTSYTWTTMRDDRVRPAHRDREGRVFRWREPPPGGHPGSEHNCRCMARPVAAEAMAVVGPVGQPRALSPRSESRAKASAVAS